VLDFGRSPWAVSGPELTNLPRRFLFGENRPKRANRSPIACAKATAGIELIPKENDAVGRRREMEILEEKS
jgi:hypothetical protein